MLRYYGNSRRGTEQERLVKEEEFGREERGRRRKEEGEREDIRTEADEGGKERKNLWEGKEGNILIRRGKRGRQQWAKTEQAGLNPR